MSSPDAGLGHRLHEAMAHPVRVRVLSFLAEEPGAGAKAIAERIGHPLRSVRHHLAEMRKHDLVEAVEERRRRGASERFYSLVRPPVIDDSETEGLGARLKLRISTETLKLVFDDATTALRAGTFDGRHDRLLARVRCGLDEQGWSELAAIQRRACEEVERVKAESEARLQRDGAVAIAAVAVLMAFELPADPEKGA